MERSGPHSMTLFLALSEPGDHVLVAKVVNGHVELERSDSNENARWISPVMRITTSRRLAITGNGHVGLVPPTAREGDDVFVLYGCSMTLLPGRNGKSNARCVVGECLFPRMMNGQIVDTTTLVEDPGTPLPSMFVDKEASAEKSALFRSMETLSALLPDPVLSYGWSAQWFCIT
jgi:hypothetical protein